MISPLYLLMTLRLSRKSFHRRTVIDLAARLGPHKPPPILAVENLIWDAIFRLSKARVSVHVVLRDLANSLSDFNAKWDESHDDAHKWWFSLDSGMILSLLEF